MAKNNQNSSSLLRDRRGVVFSALAASASGAVTLTSQRALAQAPPAVEPPARNLQALAIIGRQAVAAQDQLIKAVEPPLEKPTSEEEFLAAQQEICLTLRRTLVEIPEGQRINYVCGANIGVAVQIQEQNIPLVPTEDQVIAETKRPSGAIAPPAPSETLVDVLIDILLETLGINSQVRGGIAKFFQDSPIKTLFNELAQAVTQRNAALVALRAERLFVAVFGRQTLVQIAALIGPAEFRLLLGRVAARFVPFIGWALWAASFVYALHKNWARLQASMR
jgi:hypothetical protein